MISHKYAVLIALLLTNAAFSADVIATQNQLTIAAINIEKRLFNVREIHDMGKSGTQQIDYVVNCAEQTMALASFSVINLNGRLRSSVPASNNTTLSFYQPVIDHDKKIAYSVCQNMMTMNNSINH